MLQTSRQILSAFGCGWVFDVLAASCMAIALLSISGSVEAQQSDESKFSNQQHYEAVSDSSLYRIVIYPESEKTPIGEMHRWVIRVMTDKYTPVYPARISVGGGMESHGHGLPTQPQVVAYGGNGEYLIDGMRFNMAGMWRLSFVIESEHGVDRANFEIEVTF